MGQTGSFTAKVDVASELTSFTKWGSEKIRELSYRSQHSLSNTFALRYQEFLYLIGVKTLRLGEARAVFQRMFDTDGNKLVDKFEIICAICLLSALSSEEKVLIIFEVFDFNNKGFLVENEMILLFRSIAKCSAKIDPNMKCLSPEKIDEMTKTSLTYGLMSPNTLRKYELVLFAANTQSVRAFLEAWRGHASQVLLAPGQLWQDRLFPALHASIAPSPEWMNIGLPPNGFVKWRRRVRLLQGCLSLFGHSERIGKSADISLYSGVGALGFGVLKQGLLADRWVLNALATVIVQPSMAKYLHAVTGQEDLGRFCVRIFEGAGWSSVFLDDRIPSDPTIFPLFMHSSADNECWPLIVEKALAKRLGSYGHVGAFGLRNDSSEYALRMFTGGHVFKQYARDYEWLSVSAEVQDRDGMAFVNRMLNEGSLISFGLSDVHIFQNQKKVRQKEDTNIYPGREGLPHGRLFPVVATEVIRNYKHLVLRDAWGVIPDCTLEPHPKYGHCRLFKVRCEDILSRFDTIFISRLPDSRRTSVFIQSQRLLSAHYTPPWMTEIITQPSMGVKTPAMFLLTVFDIPFVENHFDKPSKKKGKDTGAVEEKPVEISLSLTSTYSWGDCVNSATLIPPKLWGRICATAKTRSILTKKKQFIQDSLRSTVPLQVPEAVAEVWNFDKTPSGLASHKEADGKPSKSEKETVLPNQKASKDVRDLDISFSCERSWVSHSFLLYPGQYIIMGHVRIHSSTANKNHDAIPGLPEGLESEVDAHGHKKGSAIKNDGEVELGMWAQVSSTSKFSLNVLPNDIKVENEEIIQSNSLYNYAKNTPIPVERWPFAIEQQHEISSKGMIDVVTRVRSQCDVTNAELLKIRFNV